MSFSNTGLYCVGAPLDRTAVGALQRGCKPRLTIIEPTTGEEELHYVPIPASNGGGYDDLAFTRSGTFISASNPTLNGDGVNTHRAIGIIRVDDDDSPVVTTVLRGNAMATDRTTGERVQLNLTDPDSLSIDPNTGEVVLNDQGDSQLIFMSSAGDEGEVSRLLLQPAGTNAPVVDETTWTTSASGHFLVADHADPGAIWVIHKTGGFTQGQAYVGVANDSPTFTSTLATLNTSTGDITPVVTDFASPKGIIFIE